MSVKRSTKYKNILDTMSYCLLFFMNLYLRARIAFFISEIPIYHINHR